MESSGLVRVISQLDESIDVRNISHVIIFGWYVENHSICDEFLLLKAVTLTTKAVDVFLVDDFLKKTYENHWTEVDSFCSDGSSSVPGHRSGFVRFIRAVVWDFVDIHCFSSPPYSCL